MAKASEEGHFVRLASLVATGFRNLEGEVAFPRPLSLMVGENNSGKSNVIDALRILTVPRNGMRFSRWVTTDDFRHDAGGARETDEFKLTAKFVDLSDREIARMVTCLAPSLGERCAQLSLVAQLGPTERISVTHYGGDSLQPGVEQYARETIQHTYLHPLRDAGADLRPGRDNKLINLLTTLAPLDSEGRAEIERVAENANQLLYDTAAIKEARTEIQERLEQILGPLFAQKTDLRFSDPRFDRIVAALSALAGETEPLELAENGLGFNNLLYIATLLAAVDNSSSEEGLHLLLVEEPEAHLHPQLQDLLLRYLQDEADSQSQVVVTTHSPNFASGAGAERTTVMAREQSSRFPVSRSPALFGLDQKELDHLDRFLDVTKSSLLFARGVVLVEGIAEQLLLPRFAQLIGVDLMEHGIAVINVGGLSFRPFSSLFSRERVPQRCAIISDGDPPNREKELDGGEELLSATARKLKETEHETLRVFLAAKTFEWDLANAGNWTILVQSLSLIKPRVASRLSEAHGESDNGVRADALLEAVQDIKGRFAQALAQELRAEQDLIIPKYLRDAIQWVAGLSNEA